MKASFADISKSLLEWYKQNSRELPWRRDRDAYKIWISEVMLQQTTVVAVIPYYEKFLKAFPDVQQLAEAPLSQVLENWAGLGYYSRARNLHKAAQILSEQGFPKTAEALLELPGFGPYTSRAVSSIAFGEKVGVLDGNVIRVLTRLFGMQVPWWQTVHRLDLQKKSDLIAAQGPSHLTNQALMELGATVCTPQSPLCLLCPWQKFCVARKRDLISLVPVKKPRKAFENWIWDVQLYLHKDKVGMIENDYLPFLKGQWVFPGSCAISKQKPKRFDAKHGITHHDIYIRIAKPIKLKSLDTAKAKDYRWVAQDKIKSINPSSLLQKVLSSVASS